MSEVKAADISALRDYATQMKAALEKGQSDLAAEFNTKMDAINDAIDKAKLEAKQALANAAPATKEGEESFERKAFRKLMLGGSKSLTTPEEQKALSTFEDPQAGYLVAPKEYLRELNRLVTEISPVRQVARVISINGDGIEIPKVDANITASWTAELAEKSETEPTVGKDVLTHHELSAYTEVSHRLDMDSAIAIEGFMNEQFAEQFAKAEGTAFISGNGVGKPFGITASADINTAKTNSTTTLSVDGLMNAVYSLKEVYRSNGSWMMNRLTIREVRKLLAANEATFLLWAQTLRDGQPENLLGYPVYEAPDLTAPNALTGAFTQNDIAALFGDYRRGYVIVDRMQMRVIRDDVSKARTGRIAFTALRYVGGKVIRGEAITKLVVDNT